MYFKIQILLAVGWSTINVVKDRAIAARIVRNARRNGVAARIIEVTP